MNPQGKININNSKSINIISSNRYTQKLIGEVRETLCVHPLLKAARRSY
jgi:hypothetical protein